MILKNNNRKRGERSVFRLLVYIVFIWFVVYSSTLGLEAVIPMGWVIMFTVTGIAIVLEFLVVRWLDKKDRERGE